MKLAFTKMQALGNDFMVINAINHDIRLTQADIRQLAHRHLGIGFDQCLIIDKPNDESMDFFYRIFNADGAEVGQCGNGVRCVARYLLRHDLAPGRQIRIASSHARFDIQINADNTVTVGMGPPNLALADIPMRARKQQSVYQIVFDEQTWLFQAISMGNPHAVITVDDLEFAPVKKIGAELSKHAVFPEGANIGFMQITSPESIKLRVYERGVGETLACGSGACAAVVAGRLNKQLDSEVDVILPGGRLRIFWEGEHTPVYMTGAAEFVFDGYIHL